MSLQKINFLIIASTLLASTLVAADPPTTVPSRPDQPPPKPSAQKPLAPGPGKLLLFRNGRLVLLDPDGKNEKEVTAGREAVHGDARLSPDGKRVAALIRSGAGGGEQQMLHVRTLDEKRPGTDLGVECKMLVSVLWSPDGAEVAFAEVPTDGRPRFAHFVVDVKKKEKKALRLPDGHLLTDWSRDGKLFLTTRFVADKEKPESSRARLYLVNRDGTERKALTDEKQYSVFGRLSPDGTRVLYGRITPPADGKGPPKRELTTLDIPTGKSAVVSDTPLNGEILCLCWSPDGKQIAYIWRQLFFDAWYEGVPVKETESHLVVCDPDGKNAKTIASEKGNSPKSITLGWVDWR
jgi:Tol biopolymer transport system component